MARPLHRLSLGTILFTCVCSGMNTGCVISPPIEAEPIPPDRSPRLEIRDPEERTVTVTAGEVVALSVRARDENPHDFLDVVWVGDQVLRPSIRTVARQSDQLEDGEIEYRFNVVERQIDVCDELEDVTRETVTVFVADAELALTGSEVELSDPASGGFITSTSWILELEGVCP